MDTFISILIYVGIFIAGLLAGVFLARFIVKKEFEKNPPINDDMIEAMLRGAGQTPTKKRINQIRRQMSGSTKK